MSRMKVIGVCVLGAMMLPLTGCGFLEDVLNPNRVLVRLVNDSDSRVDVTLYVGRDDNVLEDVLTTLGEKLEYSLGAGESVSFTRDCDRLQAIIVDDARLRVVGEIGPQTRTGVLRDGDDFFCGDSITFTFDHSVIVVDFGVSVDIEADGAR